MAMWRILLIILLLSTLNPIGTEGAEIVYPEIPGVQSPQNLPAGDLNAYVKYIITLAMYGGGILFFGILLLAGIKYLTAQGNPEKLLDAKKSISSALVGLLILFSSFIILKTINPQFILLEELAKLPPAEKVNEEAKGFPEGKFASLIGTSINFGQVIEKGVFQSSGTNQESQLRMERISKEAQSIVIISNTLTETSGELSLQKDLCHCFKNTNPDPRCTNVSACPASPPRCSSDPCKPVRDKIQELEQKNLVEISKLNQARGRIIDEVRLLKEELKKLEEAEQLMAKCDAPKLISKHQYLVLAQTNNEPSYFFREGAAWDEYTENDWASFVCPVSGTMMEQFYGSSGENFNPLYNLLSILSSRGLSDLLELEDDLPQIEKIQRIPMAAVQEADAGEVIDQTKRLGGKLVQNLSSLLDSSGKIITDVSSLHQLVSQCSSRRCFPVCYTTGNPPVCVEVGCFGLPCPTGEIDQQVVIIKETLKDLEKIVKGAPAGTTNQTASQSNLERIGTSQDYYSCRTTYQNTSSALKNRWVSYCQNNGGIPVGKRGEFKTYIQNLPDINKFRGNTCNLPEVIVEDNTIANFHQSYLAISSDPERLNESKEKSCERAFDGTVRNQLSDSGSCIAICVENDIKEEIPNAINAPAQTAQGSEIGIIPLIQTKVPQLLERLGKNVRNPMDLCVPDVGGEKYLFSCEAARGAVNINKKLITDCCYQESWYGGPEGCLQECYLETENNKYNVCLNACLQRKSEELNIPAVATCRHRLNFYCIPTP